MAILNRTKNSPLVNTVVIDTSHNCQKNCAGCYLKTRPTKKDSFYPEMLRELLIQLKAQNICRDVSIGVNPGYEEMIELVLGDDSADFPCISLQCKDIDSVEKIVLEQKFPVDVLGISSVDPSVKTFTHLNQLSQYPAYEQLVWNFMVRDSMIQGMVGAELLMEYERCFDIIYLNREKPSLGYRQEPPDYNNYVDFVKSVVDHPDKIVADICVARGYGYCYPHTIYVSPDGAARLCPYVESPGYDTQPRKSPKGIINNIKRLVEKKDGNHWCDLF